MFSFVDLFQKREMAGCAMSFQFSSVVKLRNEISSLRIRNRDSAFGDLVKEMKVPVLRISGVSGKQRSRLLMVNMSQSPAEPQLSGAAATEVTKGGEESGSILRNGNGKNLGTEKPERDGNVGDGFNGSDGNNGGFNNGGGGGGSGGGEGDGGEDYEEKEFGPLLKFEEVMRETEARGATLPSDMLEAAKTFGIRKLLLLRYLDLQVRSSFFVLFLFWFME